MVQMGSRKRRVLGKKIRKERKNKKKENRQ